MLSPIEDRFRESLRPSDINELKRLADEAMELDAVEGERVLWTQILSVTSAMRSKKEDHILPEDGLAERLQGRLERTEAHTSPGYQRCRIAVHKVSRDGTHMAGWLSEANDDGRVFINVSVPAFQWWRAVISVTEAPKTPE
ncbi:MAG: hypothetical protein JRH11_15375 [Deltaproteobacteria bacterium]|nr:hypothetical protein [Deltaproteobacteria bacterium]